MMKAMEECEGGHSSSIKPTNPFAQLNKPTNPFQTLPAQAPRSPFGSASNSKPQINANALKDLLFNNYRNKRQAGGLIEVTEEDFEEFLEDFAEFKDDVASKMSNLTCVLSKLDMLDANYQVNIKSYTEGIWRKMVVDGYNDCYDVARSFPQSALNKNPIMKVFGRHMVFFKCAKKV